MDRALIVSCKGGQISMTDSQVRMKRTYVYLPNFPLNGNHASTKTMFGGPVRSGSETGKLCPVGQSSVTGKGNSCWVNRTSVTESGTGNSCWMGQSSMTESGTRNLHWVGQSSMTESGARNLHWVGQTSVTESITRNLHWVGQTSMTESGTRNLHWGVSRQ